MNSLNARIAYEVMDWQDVRESIGGPSRLIHGLSGKWVPDFAHSLDACAIAEAEIEKRGLMVQYQHAITVMWAEMNPNSKEEHQRLPVFLIHLSPKHRCEAMLIAVGASDPQ